MQLKQYFEQIPNFIAYLEREQITCWSQLEQLEIESLLKEQIQIHELFEIKKIIERRNNDEEEVLFHDTTLLRKQLAKHDFSETVTNTLVTILTEVGIYSLDNPNLTCEVYEQLINRRGKSTSSMIKVLNKLGFEAPKRVHPNLLGYQAMLEPYINLEVIQLIPYTKLSKADVNRLKRNGIHTIEDIFTKELPVADQGLLQNLDWAEQFCLACQKLKEQFPPVKFSLALSDLYSTYCINELSKFGIEQWDDFQIIENLILLDQTKLKKVRTDAISKYPRYTSPKEYLKSCYLRIQEDGDFEILVHRYLDKLVLEKCGEKRGVTRERIRQIQNRLILQLKIAIDLVVKEWKSELNPGSYRINIAEYFDNFIEKDYLILINILKEFANESFTYCRELDAIFLVTPEQYHETQEMLKENLLELPCMLTTTDMFEYVEIITSELDSFLSEDDVLNLMLKLKYRQVDQLYIDDCASKYQIMAEFLYLYYSNGLVLEEDTVAVFREHLYQLTGIDTREDSFRSIEGRFQSMDKIVLFDKSTYGSFKSIEITDSLLESILDYIDRQLDTRACILVKTVFINFEEELKNHSNIDKYEKLYGLLKYRFPQNYDFHKFKIAKADHATGTRKTNVDQVIEWIKTKGNQVTLVEFKEVFQLEQSSISPILTGKNRFILSNKGKVITYYEESPFSEGFCNDLACRIEATMIDGYCNQQMLFDKNPVFFLNHGIDSGYDAFSVAQYVFHEQFAFYRPTIQRIETTEIITMKSLLLRHIAGTEMSYQDLKHHFVDGYCCSDITFSNLMYKFADELTRVTYDEFTLRQQVHLEQHVCDTIEAYITSKLQLRDYLLTQDLQPLLFKGLAVWINGSRRELNQYSLVSLIESNLKHCCKVIYASNRDYRYEIPLILSKKSGHTAIDIIVDEIDGYLHNSTDSSVTAVTHHLKQLGLINATIPLEVLEDSRVFLDSFNTLRVKHEAVA